VSDDRLRRKTVVILRTELSDDNGQRVPVTEQDVMKITVKLKYTFANTQHTAHCTPSVTTERCATTITARARDANTRSPSAYGGGRRGVDERPFAVEE